MTTEYTGEYVPIRPSPQMLAAVLRAMGSKMNEYEVTVKMSVAVKAKSHFGASRQVEDLEGLEVGDKMIVTGIEVMGVEKTATA